MAASGGARAPVQVVDAGPGTGITALGDRDALLGLGERMDDVRQARTAEEILRRLVDLVCTLVEADAVAIELRGSATAEPPLVMVHRGLDVDEALPGASVPQRFAHRLELPITSAGGHDGRLSLWRASRGFDAADRDRADLAATTVAVLVHQVLRRLESAQRRRWLESTEEIFDAVVGTAPTSDVLRLSLDRMRAVAGADLAWLVTGTPARPVLQVLSSDKEDPSDGCTVDLRGSLSAHVLATGTPVQVNDLAGASQIVISEPWEVWLRAGAALVEPVRADGRVIAGLGLAWVADRSASYLALDPALPPRFAQLASLAIGVGLARADAERLAVLEERDRIRLDLHDRAIQRLYALGMGLETARLRNDAASVGGLLDDAVDRVDETIAEIRRTIAGVGTADEGMDLYDALAAAVDQVASTAAFRPELRVLGLARFSVSAEVSHDLVAVLEEALSNVVRHAQATRCRVTLTVDGEVRLTVDDDGRGVPPGVVGSGLSNLRRRAEAHGGALTVTALAPGTRLAWAVPHRRRTDSR